MSNRTHFILAVLFTAAILLDVAFNSAMATTFMLRKLVDFIDYVAFWR